MMLFDTALTADGIRAFERDGALALRNVISSNWIKRLTFACERRRLVATDPGDYYVDKDFNSRRPIPAVGHTFVKENNWKEDTDVRAFIHESPLADIARAVMGSQSVRLYEDLIIGKDAGSDQPTPWHQDDGQWPLTGKQMCSIWFCLEESTQTTGALRFAAGSHHGPLYTPYLPPGREADREEFEGGDIPDIDADPMRFPVIGFDVSPGDAVLFHPRVVHSALGSARAHPRRSFSFRFLGDDVRWKARRNVYYPFLLEIPLKDGDKLADAWFPLLRTAKPAQN